ncbi:MAG: GTPase [Candidatus Helarchaeota archaeon]
MKNAVLVMLKTNPSDHIKFRVQMNELRALAQTQYNIIAEIIQTKLKPKVKYLIGNGKIQELKQLVEQKNIEKIIFYNNLTSKQKYNIRTATGCDDVSDRYDLILEIFEKMSKDNLSKLQIEKARLIKEIPMIKLAASIKLRTEHPGAMGSGEYAYHSKIRRVQEKIAKINSKITKLRKLKESWFKKREKLKMPVICLTGNYNAGKTTLFNLLTGSQKPVSNEPFTTLSSKYMKLTDRDMLFVDTIGFVIDIDPKLIESFELNIFDIIHANIILYLIDVSEDIETLKIKFLSGFNILLDLGIDHNKMIIVFNKIDKITKSDLESKISAIKSFIPYNFKYVEISALNSINIDELINKIEALLYELED